MQSQEQAAREVEASFAVIWEAAAARDTHLCALFKHGRAVGRVHGPAGLRVKSAALPELWYPEVRQPLASFGCVKKLQWVSLPPASSLAQAKAAVVAELVRRELV